MRLVPIIAFLLCCPAFAQEPSAIDLLAKNCQAEKEKAIKAADVSAGIIKAQVEAAQQEYKQVEAIKPFPASKTTAAQKKVLLAQAKAKIAKLEDDAKIAAAKAFALKQSPLIDFVPEIEDLSLNAVGKFAGYDAKVSQVTGKDELLASANFTTGWENVLVRGVVAKSPVIDRKSFFVHGISTEGKTSDSKLKLGIVHVKGTKTYTTVLGASRTVFVVVEVDLSKLE